MKKKAILALLTTVSMAVCAFTGCGSTENAVDTLSTEQATDEKVSPLENNESLEAESTEKNPASSNVSKENKDKTENTVAPIDTTSSEEKSKTDNSNSENSQTDTNNSKNSQTNTSNSGNTGSKPSGGNSTTNTDSSNQPASTQDSQPSAPAHEHVWHEHTVTTQQWVPNMVTVDDYETRKVAVGSMIQCNCGATFTDVASAEEHGVAHVLAGEPDNCESVPIWEDQQVKVGSHQEDQGHYETVTTVDYYYCDCGATK